MIQVIMAVAVVAALVYFVLFRAGTPPEAESAKPYAAEVQKAEQVEDTLLQNQQLQQQRIDAESE
jgi:hypothetical protein